MQLIPVGDVVVKLTVTSTDPAIDLSRITVTLDRATAWDLKQARAADPEATRLLVEQVQSQKRNSRSYKRSRCGFGAFPIE
jgi:hypothetical protein